MKGETNLYISCEVQILLDNNNISMKENYNNDFVFGRNDFDCKICSKQLPEDAFDQLANWIHGINLHNFRIVVCMNWS